MQPTGLSHIQFNIDGDNVGFYKELFTTLGWQTLMEGDGWYAASGKNGESLWFTPGSNGTPHDHDGFGVNHVSVAAGSIADVDAVGTELQDRGIELLYGTPCHRPDFSHSENDTYYQIMFKSPDNLQFEFVYIGPKG